MLANGWFRNQQYVQTTLGRFVENTWKSCLMLRIPLKGFVWKKRLRKLYRQNTRIFEVNIQPYIPRQETENLWQNFKSNVHKWQKIPSLSDHILKGNYSSAFNTFEVSIYNGSDLVAFSLFDMGYKSIASLEAAYDISYRNNSLGVFTMLVEIAFCTENGIDYYYPGFYPKDTPMFDYKLRPGNAEFFRAMSGQWTPWESVKNQDWLLDEVLKKLGQVKELLNRFGFLSMVKVFNKVSFPALYPSISNYNFLSIGERQISPLLILLVQIAWDPFEEMFFLFKNIVEVSVQNNDIRAQSFEPFKLVCGYTNIDSLEEWLTSLPDLNNSI